MDTRQRLGVLVLTIYLVPYSCGNNVTSNATVILLEDHTLPFQKEKDLLSFIKKEKVVPSLGNLILIQTSNDVIESPSVINDALLSLLDQQTQNIPAFSDRHRRSTVMDQVTAATRTQLNSVQQLDLQDIDNFQDVIAITEYEPQKIESEKAKGRNFYNFGYTDHETTTQPFHKIYYEVSQRKGTTRVPKYGKTKVSYNIRPTEKSRYLASEIYRTPPSTLDPLNGQTKLRSSTKNSIMSTTSDYLLPSISSVSSRVLETQTRNYSNAFTTVSSPNYSRLALNETKSFDEFDSISVPRKANSDTKITSKFVASTTIFPNIPTRRSISFYSPRTSKFFNSLANFDEGTTKIPIPSTTMTTDSYTVPLKKSKRIKTSTRVLQDSNEKNVKLSLQDKARQSRALNHTDGNYKFGLLAKYDIMPRPFALRTQDPLKVAAARAQNKKFGQPQVFSTNPATIWNFNTVVPTFSAFTSHTTGIPAISSTQSIRHGYESPRRLTSRGRARFNSIKKDTEIGIDTKDLPSPEYQETSAEKVVASTKKKGQGQHHYNHRDKHHAHKPYHQHKNNLGKHHQNHNKDYHVYNRHHDRKEHHPKDEQDNKHPRGRSHQHEHDHKHHTPKYNYEHYHRHDDKHHISPDVQHKHRHGDEHSSNHDHGRETYNRKHEHDKNDHDHHEDYDHDIEHHDQDNYKNEPDESKKDEDRDHQEYEHDQEDHQQTYDYNQRIDDKHHAKDHEMKHHGYDHDHDKKLHDNYHDYIGDDEENKAESTHKHEHKHEQKKESGNHKHEAGGGAEHEKGHHSEEGEKGDKRYESWHENQKAEKGYHDKEDHNHHYDEKKGDKKKHEDEGGYHKEHHFGEKGEKAAEFGEKGEHQSGHNIKGKHFIHKKDEYEKKTEFFDEFHDDGDNEKEGEFHHEHKGGKGGHHKSGHHDEGHHEDKHGKEHHHMKGHHHNEEKGQKEDEGHEEHHHHEEKHGKKGVHEEGKKWAHKKGK